MLRLSPRGIVRHGSDGLKVNLEHADRLTQIVDSVSGTITRQ